MQLYSEAAVERAMKAQELILRAVAQQSTWLQAAEILGVSPGHMRRWQEKYEQFGFQALFAGRRGQTSPRRGKFSCYGNRFLVGCARCKDILSASVTS